MRLGTLDYDQYAGSPAAWHVSGLALGPTNLVVGVNATGKSRSISVIWSLSQMIRGAHRVLDGHFRVTWESANGQVAEERYAYDLDVRGGRVHRETLHVGGTVKLARDASGLGTIASTEGGELRFRIPENELAVVAKRDLLQHPFIEPLRAWADGVRHYRFGSGLGRGKIVIPATAAASSADEPDPRNGDNTIELFLQGVRVGGEAFTRGVIEDMCRIGYPLSRVTVGPLGRLVVAGATGPLHGICVKEDDLLCETEQHEMSDGMFRAFALIVHLNYAVRSANTSCLLVDDIGEGLDYDRSRNLIGLLMTKTEQHQIQLVMTTNDRFVMNAVPLEAWSVLVRKGGTVHVLNYQNGREIFDTFKLTGLNNFDFFAGEFWNEAAA